jgi:DNA-binding CsgD family transcriptional regulator
VVPRGDDRLPLHATVSPLTPSAGGAADETQLLWAAIYLVDPERSYETAGEQLQRIFGLTRAEAEVMHAFVSGLEPRAIARETGRAYETVRAHLKRVMEKAGVSRQAELMRLARSVLAPLRR